MKRLRAYPAWAPYFFVAPFVLIFGVFLAYPLVRSLYLSTQQSFGPSISQNVGLRNFGFLMADPLFWKAVVNTAVFAAGSVFVQLPISLGLALLLNRPDLRGRAIFRLIIFSPALVGVVFVGVVAALVFEPRLGMLNVILNGLIPAWPLDFPWLQEYVMPALIVSSLWMYCGFNMVYFLAALQSVNKDLIEAATVDGANAWHRFLNVTLPAIAPVATFVVLLSLIGSFQLFELPWVLFNQSAGPGNQGLTVVMYLYQSGFQDGDLGYASAIGWLLAVLLMGFAILQRVLSRYTEN